MKAQFIVHRLDLKHAFQVSGAPPRDFVDVGIIRLEEGGIWGYGEASPSRFWGENIDDVRLAFGSVDWQKYRNPGDFDAVMAEIRTVDKLPQSFLAACEMALIDLAGKDKKTSAGKILGIPSMKSPQSSFTIGIADLETIAVKVEEAAEYPILKVKLGGPNDIETIEKIRSLSGSIIRVDANEGWEKEEAVEKIRWLTTQNVEFIEQPLPAGHEDEIAWVRERVDLPIFADESIQFGDDIAKIAHAFDGINIKLMKCGGPNEALRMIRLAREREMKVMIGCMTEGSLAISAGAHLIPLVDYADLDGFVLITNDPFSGLTMENGFICISGEYGLGVEPIPGLFG